MIGLCFILFISWRAIEWRTYEKVFFDYQSVNVSDDDDEEIPITEQLKTPPPPPPPPPVQATTEIEIVEDEEEVEEEKTRSLIVVASPRILVPTSVTISVVVLRRMARRGLQHWETQSGRKRPVM